MSKYFEETELARVVCAMIHSFAKVCGVQWPDWDQLTETEQLYWVDCLKELSELLAEHHAEYNPELEPEPFDVSIWYQNSWRIFHWSEPEFTNLNDFNQNYVACLAEFVVGMSHYYSTQICRERA